MKKFRDRSQLIQHQAHSLSPIHDDLRLDPNWADHQLRTYILDELPFLRHRIQKHVDLANALAQVPELGHDAADFFWDLNDNFEGREHRVARMYHWTPVHVGAIEQGNFLEDAIRDLRWARKRLRELNQRIRQTYLEVTGRSLDHIHE